MQSVSAEGNGSPRVASQSMGCVSQVSRKDKLWRNKRKSRSSSSANSCCAAAGWFPMPLEQHKYWDVFCELLCSLVSLSGLLALGIPPAALYLNLREFVIQARHTQTDFFVINNGHWYSPRNDSTIYQHFPTTLS